MTIDEAIARTREVVKEQKSKYDKCPIRLSYNCAMCFHNPKCDEDAKEHEQLADWLEELKTFRENKWTDIYIKRGYNKAIDDFTKELKDYFIIPHDVKVIEMRAEQLKAGVKDD